MKKKQARFAMLVFVILATTSCTDIMGIDSDYYLRGRCDDQPRPVSDEIQYGANYVAVDVTNVYWTNRSDGRVMKMAIDTGSITELAKDQDEPRCIAVHENQVYWTNVGDDTVMRVGTDGTNLETLATGQNNPYDIVITEGYIFWTNEGTEPYGITPPPSDGSIMRLKRGGGQDPTPIVNGLTYPQAIAIHGEEVYWTDVDNLMKTGFDGVIRIKIASLPPSPTKDTQYSDITSTSTSIFWTDTDNNTVNKVGITGSKLEQLAANDQTPFGIAVDATHVYWTSSLDGAVWRVGLNGGVAEPMAENQPFPVGIAVDETCIYWANFGDGTVMKLAK